MKQEIVARATTTEGANGLVSMANHSGAFLREDTETGRYWFDATKLSAFCGGLRGRQLLAHVRQQGQTWKYITETSHAQ